MPATILTLVCHAATSATRQAAFPRDEPLDAPGAAAATAARALRRVDAAWTSPALRARQTAAALGLDAAPDPALRDLDCGHWAGRTLEQVAASDPAGAAAWMGDPDAAPHGGESVGALIRRVENWLQTTDAEGRLVAVTHAAVLRAAVIATLQAAPAAFWRIDVAPLGRIRLRGGPGRWTLTALGALNPPSPRQ